MTYVDETTTDEVDREISANYREWKESKTPSLQRSYLAAINSLLDARLDVMRANRNSEP